MHGYMINGFYLSQVSHKIQQAGMFQGDAANSTMLSS